MALSLFYIFPRLYVAQLLHNSFVNIDIVDVDIDFTYLLYLQCYISLILWQIERHHCMVPYAVIPLSTRDNPTLFRCLMDGIEDAPRGYSNS